EHLVVDPEIIDIDSRFRHARGAAGLERADRPASVRLRYPSPHRTAAQPVILKEAEAIEVLVRLHRVPGIPARLPREFEPEGRPGLRAEMPVDDVAHGRIEFGFLDGADQRGGVSQGALPPLDCLYAPYSVAPARCA